MILLFLMQIKYGMKNIQNIVFPSSSLNLQKVKYFKVIMSSSETKSHCAYMMMLLK